MLFESIDSLLEWNLMLGLCKGRSSLQNVLAFLEAPFLLL